MKKIIRKLIALISRLRFWGGRLLRSRGSVILGKDITLGFSAIIDPTDEKGVVHIGNRSIIYGELLTFGGGGLIKIGADCFFGRNSHAWSALSISIADHVLISHNVNIFDSLTHPISARERRFQMQHIREAGHPEAIQLGEKAVVIASDVLIGCNSVILRGVNIGEGAIVGAGSVVTKDVPAWTIVAGNPARVVREIPESER